MQHRGSMKTIGHIPVKIPFAGIALAGDLRVPEDPGGLVLFAYGSGSGRHSPRNRYVARVLEDGGLAGTRG
jgi:putative phosphoribosyl transferase